MSNLSSLPPGVYRIIVRLGGGVEAQALTREDKNVTILPPSEVPNPEQEWRVVPGKDGNVIIERPSPIIPSIYLTYDGAPGKAEEGARVITRLSEFPPNEWHLAIAPGFRTLIRVAGTDLGIAVAPPKIFPPILELSLERQLEWQFERVGDL